MSIQVLRGPVSRVNTITPGLGEPLWVTDTFEFRVGDGITPGGIPLTFVKTFGSVSLDQVALWDSTNNIKGQDKTTFLAGYATETFVNNGLSGKLDTGAKAADSFLADNAGLLDGQLPTFYLNTSQRSSSVTSTSTTNVATSQAAKTAYDKGVEGVNDAATAQSAANNAQSTANGKIDDADYASSTTGGTLKARLSGTDLFLTNNGSNA